MIILKTFMGKLYYTFIWTKTCVGNNHQIYFQRHSTINGDLDDGRHF